MNKDFINTPPDGETVPSFSENERQTAASAKERFTDSSRQYHRDIAGIPPLSAEEEHALAVRKSQGDKEARDRLIEANLSLVINIVKKYQGQGVPYLDLVQEGNFGLMEAVDRFDPERGTRLSTFADDWIRHYVLQALTQQSRMIRVPNYVSDELNRLVKAQRRLTAERGREPSETELAEELGEKPERIREMQRLLQEPLRLEMPSDEEEERTLGDTVSDPRSEDPGERLDRELLQKQIEQSLGRLSEREREILIRRFGLMGGRSQTFDEVGKALKLSRERIRQIQEGACKKLRVPLKGWKTRS